MLSITPFCKDEFTIGTTQLAGPALADHISHAGQGSSRHEDDVKLQRKPTHILRPKQVKIISNAGIDRCPRGNFRNYVCYVQSHSSQTMLHDLRGTELCCSSSTMLLVTSMGHSGVCGGQWSGLLAQCNPETAFRSSQQGITVPKKASRAPL